MGVLVVNCPNRPEDEMIDCGVYGLHMNMRSHNLDSINGEVLVGVPVEGKRLPAAGAEDDKTREQIEIARAWSAGAVIGTEVSGIPSNFLPGGIEPPAPPEEKKSSSDTKSETKSAQAKEGGE